MLLTASTEFKPHNFLMPHFHHILPMRDRSVHIHDKRSRVVNYNQYGYNNTSKCYLELKYCWNEDQCASALAEMCYFRYKLNYMTLWLALSVSWDSVNTKKKNNLIYNLINLFVRNSIMRKRLKLSTWNHHHKFVLRQNGFLEIFEVSARMVQFLSPIISKCLAEKQDKEIQA